MCLISYTNCRSPLPARRTPSFSLVELVIVVVIIGVIAAIAMPRVSSAAAQSGENALIADLHEMRKAVDIYAAEHNGDLPGRRPDGKSGGANSAGAFETQLTQYSDDAGKISAGRTAQYRFGPYLRAIPPIPVGPNNGSKTVAIDTVNSPPLVTAGPEAWVYNPNTGEIIANTDAPNATGAHAYDEY